MKRENPMPSFGYARGNVWKTDPLGPMFLRLDCSQKLHRAAAKRGYSSDTKFSFVGRQYVCETFTEMKFEKSENVYRTSAALQYGSTPLEAEVLAYRACVPLDAEMAALYLECEMYLLARAIRIIEPLEKALADLSEVTSELFREMFIADIASRLDEKYPERPAITVTSNEIKPQHLHAVFTGKKPETYDEDDDL